MATIVEVTSIVWAFLLIASTQHLGLPNTSNRTLILPSTGHAPDVASVKRQLPADRTTAQWSRPIPEEIVSRRKHTQLPAADGQSAGSKLIECYFEGSSVQSFNRKQVDRLQSGFQPGIGSLQSSRCARYFYQPTSNQSEPEDDVLAPARGSNRSGNDGRKFPGINATLRRRRADSVGDRVASELKLCTTAQGHCAEGLSQSATGMVIGDATNRCGACGVAHLAGESEWKLDGNLKRLLKHFNTEIGSGYFFTLPVVQQLQAQATDGQRYGKVSSCETPEGYWFRYERIDKRKQSERLTGINFLPKFDDLELGNMCRLPEIKLCTVNTLESHPHRLTKVVLSTNETNLLMKEEYTHYNCSESPSNLGERIVGGHNAIPGEAPFHVSLRNLYHERRYGFGRGLFCGGSLISADRVLTAAHCLTTKASNMAVVAGILNRFDQSERMQQRRVFRYLPHPDWSRKSMYADIGLIALQAPFNVSDPPSNLLPIQLANQGPSEGERCTIYGWGQTREGRKQFQPACLQKAEVTVLDLGRCNQSVHRVLHVPDGTFCAGSFEGGVDACQGDSGGPLVCDGALYGVVSFGWGCGRSHFPGVYTDVFVHRRWIEGSVNSDLSTWNGAGVDVLGLGRCTVLGVIIMFSTVLLS